MKATLTLFIRRLGPPSSADRKRRSRLADAATPKNFKLRGGSSLLPIRVLDSNGSHSALVG